jgi:hypothetical protein
MDLLPLIVGEAMKSVQELASRTQVSMLPRVGESQDYHIQS